MFNNYHRMIRARKGLIPIFFCKTSIEWVTTYKTCDKLWFDNVNKLHIYYNKIRIKSMYKTKAYKILVK